MLRAALLAPVFGALAGCFAIPPDPFVWSAPKLDNDDIAVSACAAKPTGHILPVFVSVTNRTDSEWTIDPGQVFALTTKDCEPGSRALPIPPTEAAHMAESRSAAVAAGVKNAVSAPSTLGAALVGAVGAVAAVDIGGLSELAMGTGLGAAAGAGFGAVVGGLYTFLRVRKSRASDEASQRNDDLTRVALDQDHGKPRQVDSGASIGGYVYFYQGQQPADYPQFEVLLTKGGKPNAGGVQPEPSACDCVIELQRCPKLNDPVLLISKACTARGHSDACRVAP